MMTGIFITFEGPDGAGKTTQLTLLADYLRQQGHVVRLTREPGGTPLSDKIRTLLLDPSHSEMDARTEALLYMASRAQHVAEVIEPGLVRGEVILCDRFADSTVVYQGAARRLAKQELLAINRFATGGLTPSLTILLDCDTRLLTDRRKDRGGQDRIEQEAECFHDKVRQGFLDLAEAEPERIKLVSAKESVNDVHDVIVNLVEEFLRRRGKREDK